MEEQSTMDSSQSEGTAEMEAKIEQLYALVADLRSRVSVLEP